MKGADVVVARMREGAKQLYDALGAANDSRDADGPTVFSFSQVRARCYFARKAREFAGQVEEET